MTTTTPTHALPAPPPAYILAGGMSRRFGSDKARAILRGKPLLVGIADGLRTMGFAVTAVARRRDQYADLGLHTIADLVPDQGPLGGLRTALAHRGRGWLVLCSCDMIDVDARWIAALFEQLRHAPDADAFAACDERWQPFPGLYHSNLHLDPALQNARSFQHLLERVHTVRIDTANLPRLRQANTVEELHRVDAPGGEAQLPQVFLREPSE